MILLLSPFSYHNVFSLYIMTTTYRDFTTAYYDITTHHYISWFTTSYTAFTTKLYIYTLLDVWFYRDHVIIIMRFILMTVKTLSPSAAERIIWIRRPTFLFVFLGIQWNPICWINIPCRLCTYIEIFFVDFVHTLKWTLIYLCLLFMLLMLWNSQWDKWAIKIMSWDN